MSNAIQLIKTSTNVRVNSKATVNVVDEEGVRTTTYTDESVAGLAYQEISQKIKEWLLAENFVVLTGAGTSITSDNTGKSLDSKSNKFTGKTIYQIWNECKKVIDQNDVTTLQALLNEPEKGFQLERFISKLEIYSSANEHDNRVDTKSNVAMCIKAKQAIIDTIKSECNLTLHDHSPHKKFLRSIMSARNSTRRRLQLFTLNYDTLFEQAGEQINATIVDGFSFTRKPVFHGSNFDLDIVKRERHRIHDQENYEEKVFQLFKLHGSLDWEESEDKNRVVRLQSASDNPIIIPPSNHKFEQSYQMPFFEMMSRFQQTLRRENTVLLIIGYSFSDLHINRAILEALESNLNFELAVVSPTITNEKSTQEVVSLLNEKISERSNNNITLISDTFQRFVDEIPMDLIEEDQSDSKMPEDAITNQVLVEESTDESVPF